MHHISSSIHERLAEETAASPPKTIESSPRTATWAAFPAPYGTDRRAGGTPQPVFIIKGWVSIDTNSSGRTEAEASSVVSGEAFAARRGEPRSEHCLWHPKSPGPAAPHRGH